jgi:Extensin-like protein C-terminus
MSKSRVFLWLAVVLSAGAVIFRQGLLPPKMSPLPALNLDYRGGWLVDWQLAEIRRDVSLCARVIQNPNIDARPIADMPVIDGCGLRNGVRVSAAGGARMPVDKMSCEAAVAVAQWLAHDVQPLAELLLGQRITSVQHMGSYSCRNIATTKIWNNFRSEHATANALDVKGFTLADGRTITVLKNWRETVSKANSSAPFTVAPAAISAWYWVQTTTNCTKTTSIWTAGSCIGAVRLAVSQAVGPLSCCNHEEFPRHCVALIAFILRNTI